MSVSDGDLETSLPEQSNNEVLDDRPASGSSGVFFALLALLISLIAASAMGWFYWDKKQSADALATMRSSLKTEIASIKDQIQNSIATVQAEQTTALDTAKAETRTQTDASLATMQAENAALKAQIAALEVQIGERFAAAEEAIVANAELSAGNSDELLLNEASYMLRMAARQATIANNSAAAIAAYAAADEAIARSGRIELAEVRQLIRREMGLLRKFEQPDIEGILLRLNDIAETSISMALPLPVALSTETAAEAAAEPVVAVAEKNTAAGSSEEAFVWSWDHVSNVVLSNAEELGNEIAATVAEAIVMPTSKPSTSANPTAKREYARNDAVRKSIREASSAAIRGDQAAYATALSNALDLVKQQFDLQDTTVAYVVDEIDTLSQLSVRLDVAGLGDAEKLLRQLVIDAGANQ